jgi:hypothetical protein
MAWERLLEKDQLEIIIDTERGHLMVETSSGGAVPKFITVHIQTEEEIDEVIQALLKAKAVLSTMVSKATQ